MATTFMPQATAARNLLHAIRQRIVDCKGPFHGYSAAALAAGYTDNGRDAGRAMGQVTSRIDLAAFYAGLPMLAVHWVRNPDGKINPASFQVRGCHKKRSKVWQPHTYGVPMMSTKCWPKNAQHT